MRTKTRRYVPQFMDRYRRGRETIFQSFAASNVQISGLESFFTIFTFFFADDYDRIKDVFYYVPNLDTADRRTPEEIYDRGLQHEDDLKKVRCFYGCISEDYCEPSS